MSNKVRGATAGGVPFIVSAPSGAGKTTLCKMAVDFFPNLVHSISYTTRSPREGERDGVEYWFIDDKAFDGMVERGEFIEHAGVYGKKYGTSRKDLQGLLAAGKDVLIEIDVQGASVLRKALKGGVHIFIMPPSVEDCRRRLTSRGKDAPEEIEKRMKIALGEIRDAPNYDYIIINENLEEAFEDLKAIIRAEKAKKERMLPRVREQFGIP